MRTFFLSALGLLLLLPQLGQAQAEIQGIHNSPDPAADPVDVYVDGSPIATLNFREATSFQSVPSGTTIEVAIAPSSGTYPADTIAKKDYTLSNGQRYVLVVNGTVGTDVSFDVTTVPNGAPSGAGNVGFRVHHGSEDADSVDVNEIGFGAGQLVNDLAYQGFTPVDEVTTQDGYQLQVQNDSNAITYGCYEADLSSLGLDGQFVTLFASGFVDTASAVGDSTFGLYAATAGGTVVKLPECPKTKLQAIHNSPDPNADTVDLYVNGLKAADDLAFREATPYVDVPAGRDFEVALAPKNSTSSLDSLWRDSVQLSSSSDYVAAVNGTVGSLSLDAATIQSTATMGQTGFRVHHGSEDAGAVDVIEIGAGLGTIVNGLAFPNYEPYQEVPAVNGAQLKVQNDANTITYGCFEADLATLGLAGDVITVFASGYVDTSSVASNQMFGLYAATRSGAVVELPACPTTKAQAIHNSPDPAADTVDIWVDGRKAVDDLPFRHATPFVDFPAGRDFELAIAPKTSTSAADSVKRDTVQLMQSQEYLIVANGNVGNLSLDVDTARTTASSPSNTDVLVHHGSPDAPTVDVVETSVGAGTLVNDISYSDFDPNGYLELSTNDYLLEVRNQAGDSTVACFSAPLQTLSYGDSVLTLLASGYLSPSNSPGDSAFGLFAAERSGGELVKLPSCPTTVGQVIHNSPDANASTVDLYLNGERQVNDLDFRNATPFVDLPAGREVELAVAPGNSNSVADSVHRDTVRLPTGSKYILVADGILENSSGYAADSTFGIEVYNMARQSANAGGNTDVLVHHGSPDAGPVDVVETQVGAGTIVNNLTYTGFQGYLPLTTTDYDLEVRDSTGSATVACFDAPLQSLNLGDSAITLLASGFLDPSQNDNGPALGLYAATADGGSLVELNSCPTSIEKANAASSLKVYPNPSKGSVWIDAPASGIMDARLEIYDLAGRMVQSESSVDLDGSDRYRLDLKGLEEGSYILRMIGPKEVHSAPIELVR